MIEPGGLALEGGLVDATVEVHVHEAVALEVQYAHAVPEGAVGGHVSTGAFLPRILDHGTEKGEHPRRGHWTG